MRLKFSSVYKLKQIRKELWIGQIRYWYLWMQVEMKHAWLSQACADQCMQTRQLQKYNHIGLTLDW